MKPFVFISLTLLNTLTFAMDQTPAKIWSGDFELGLGNTTGNSISSNLMSKLLITAEKDNFSYNIKTSSYRSADAQGSTAEKYFISNQLNMKLNDEHYIFGYASYDRDLFSGYDYQSSFSLGYGRFLINNEAVIWKGEIGPGYGFNKIEATITDKAEKSDGAFLRLATNYEWKFSEYSSLIEDFWVEAGTNTISRSETALTAKVIGELLLKLSFIAKYTEEIPLDKVTTDTETAMTVLYKF